MEVLAFILGLSVGIAFLAPALRKARTQRAIAEAARALERSTQVELCVVRERHAGEVAGLRRSHDDERNGSIERLVGQVAATVERVERELRRIDRRPRSKRR
jgi:hypothetical protein